MVVETTMTTRWEIDEEKLFVTYSDEWKEFLDGDSPDEELKKDFITETLWQIVPHFEEVDGLEIYDNCEIDVEL